MAQIQKILRLFISIVACFFLLQTTSSFANANTTESYSVDTISNPRLKNFNFHVSDPDSLLSQNTVDYINSKLSSLERETGIQSAVIMLPFIGNNNIFEFSQNLFRSWGLGNKEQNNGLLIVYVDDQHLIRFHTGYGLEGALPDSICKRIQINDMIPFFKQGDRDSGMKAGIDAVCLYLSDTNALPKSEPKPSSNDDDDDFELTLYTVIGTIIVILLGAGGVIVYNIFRKCPNCGKRGTLKTIKEKEITKRKRDFLYVTKKCTHCGYEIVLKYDVTGQDNDSNGNSGNAGSSGGGYGGGSSGGGGAGSHW